MKVFFAGSFVLFICYTLQLTTCDSGVQDSPSGSTIVSPTGDPKVEQPHGSDPGGESAEAQTVTVNVDDLPKELERRLSALSANFKQLVGQLKAEWNRDTMLQAVLATDKSLTSLKELNQGIEVLPLKIRSKFEKLEQSVENIKTTVYHLIHSHDVGNHSFTGKIGNNSISLDSLSAWVGNLSSQVIELEQTLSSSSETLAKVSEDLRLELKQLLIFVDRIGLESIPVELQNKVHQLETSVTDFVSKILSTIEIRKQIYAEIQSLRTHFETHEKSGELTNLSSFRHLKKKIASIMTLVKQPNIPTSLMKDAEAVENVILLAEQHHVSVLLWKLEKVLGDIGTELSFTKNVTDLIHIKHNLEYVLTQAHKLQIENISMEVQIRVFLIKQMAMKYKEMIEGMVGYHSNPGTLGVNISLHEYGQTTFEKKLEHLQHQYEQLKNLFDLKHSPKVLNTIKYQIEKIIIHLNYLKTSDITPFQRQLTVNVLKEINYFYEIVLNKLKTIQSEDESSYSTTPINLELESPNNSSQQKGSFSQNITIEHLNTSLANVEDQLRFPLDLLRMQEISVKLFEIINELRILEESHLSADQQRETNRIKQRVIEILIQIQLLTQDETYPSKSYNITGNNNGSKHHFNFEAYMEEFEKQILNLFRNTHYLELNFNNTNSHSEEEDIRRRDILDQNDTFSNNNDCVGRQTYDRDLLLISARVDSLLEHFSQLMDGARSADASFYEEHKLQAEEMLEELKTLHAFSALPRELKFKIEDLQQDLKIFEEHVQLMLSIEIDGANTTRETPQPSSSMPNDENEGKAGLNETISSFLSRLEAIRIQLPNETRISHIYQIKMLVQRMLLRVQSLSWNVPDSQRDRLHQVKREIISLFSDIELKIETIRKILPGHTAVSDERSISQLFYQIEHLMQKLRRLTLGRNQISGPGILLEEGQNIQDQWAGVTIDLAKPGSHGDQNEIRTVLNRLKYLKRVLQRLNTESTHTHGGITQIRKNLNIILLELKKLNKPTLPRTILNEIDLLTSMGNYMKVELDHAGNKPVVNEVQHRPRQEGVSLIGYLSEGLKNIQQNYFSTKDPLRLVHVLGDVYVILDQLRELQNKSTELQSTELSQYVANQQEIAQVFVKTVKKRVWTKILSPIKSEVGDLLASVDPKQTSGSGQRNETLAVERDVSTLISDMNGLEVRIGAPEIRNRITAIVNHVLQISKTYTPEAFPKTEAKLTKIVQSYL